MSDSLRTDGSRALDGVSDADRDAKIEQLLLDGLDRENDPARAMLERTSLKWD